jgi:hypothetical protein
MKLKMSAGKFDTLKMVINFEGSLLEIPCLELVPKQTAKK